MLTDDTQTAKPKSHSLGEARSRRICAHVTERTYMHALALKAKHRITFNQQVEEGLKLLAKHMQTHTPAS